jgi:uncharacterized protein
MLYRPFGRTGEMVSILGFGAMRLPVVNNDYGEIDAGLATEMLRYAIDHGVNYVDTAWMYHFSSPTSKGTSEGFLGEALSGGYRDKVLLATKLPLGQLKARADMDRILAGQLADLRTDHIDCYLLHGIGGATWERFKQLGVIDFLDAAKADGRIRYAGFSFHDDGSTFKGIVDEYGWDLCQIQYNYMDTDFQAGRAGLHYAAGRGLGVVAMEPLKGGRLAVAGPPEVQALWSRAPVERTPRGWALRFVWDDPGVSLLLSGMSTMEQVVENVALAAEGEAGSLSQEELALLREVSEAYRKRLRVDCTACRYCLPCPNGIDIPLVFAFLNDAALYDSTEEEKRIYGIETQVGTSARASECTECGQCADVCPQGIEVPQMMAECARVFDGEGA